MTIMGSLKEEKAVVLDFLPHGYPNDKRPMHMKSAIVQAIGQEHFSLLELAPKKGITLVPNEEVYIGEGKRERIHHILGRLGVEKLTATARSEIKFVVEDIVKKSPNKYLEFFNQAQPLSTRMHQLELLPGLGKKHMWEILEERKDGDFKDFEDLKKRVRLIPDPEKLIIKRIISELQGKEKYRLFCD